MCRIVVLAALLAVSVTATDVTELRLQKLLENYDKHQRLTRESVTEVSMQLSVQDIIVVTKQQAVRLIVDFTEEWTDKRLSGLTSDREIDIRMNEESRDRIWLPDVYFSRARGVRILDEPYRHEIVTAKAQGRLARFRRFELLLPCTRATGGGRALDCSLILKSFGHKRTEVSLGWHRTTPFTTSSASAPGFTLKDIRQGACTDGAGEYSCLEATLFFQHNISFFISQVYGVSFLLVCLSWASFWMDPDSPVIRIGLGLFIVLLLTVLEVGHQGSKDNVHLQESIEVWLAFCMFFVLATTLEYVVAHVIIGILPRKVKAIWKPEVEHSEQVRRESLEASVHLHRVLNMIDALCGLTFPLIFVLFNIIYWGTF